MKFFASFSRPLVQAGFIVCILCGAASAEEAARGGNPVEYNRHIRAILSDNCFQCHGPDANERQAGLRLDQRDTALAPTESGSLAIVPGKPAESELVRRVFADDESEMMPPPESNKKLTAAEKELLKQWIAAGAEYQQHWSFIPPRRPDPPQVENQAWAKGAIDRFILARLEALGLVPSPEADRRTLIRRLSLDLTGLPPTPAEVEAFVADQRPDAYEKLVDRLLASPHYGERMAMEWLDAARFADTHGFHIDSGRDMTRWRAWVIDAFNDNLPFDQFTVHQLAGDMLPDATLEQRIASGFNRNHMINFEGGAIPEEYHNAYVVDRVNTTATVWLGLTVACAQCHDHKFDPITQKDYYRLYAFFHNVPENGLDGNKGNAAPMIKAPTREQQQTLDEFAAQIAAIEQQLVAPQPEADAAQAAWEQTALAEQSIEWKVLEPGELQSQGGATLVKLDDGSIRASGKNPPSETYTIVAESGLPRVTALRLEALPDDGLAAQGPGRSANGNFVLSEVTAAIGAPGSLQPAKLASATADFSQRDYPIEAAIDGSDQTGWAIFPEVGKPHSAILALEQPRQLEPGNVLQVQLRFVSQFGEHQIGRFRLAVTDAANPLPTKFPGEITEILAIPAPQRNETQQAQLRKYYREQISPVHRQLRDDLARAREAQTEFEKTIPTTMVMQEMPQPRDTFLLLRGEYDKRGEKVTPGVPSSLPPLPDGVPANRLGLARWLVDPAQPLTARVIVNRYWQMYFGTGIVKTSEDFGSQGEWPSHPELLDWLSSEFVSSGWDVKHIQRLIVTSATYRQSSAVTPELLARDPENRLLARGARLRLPAEFIRDQALAVSGLLDKRVGGASVSPYQPPGLWEELASRADGANWTAQVYVQSHGRDLYRRTMYTFWKRTSPPPTLTTFDAPDRETCTVRRARTNTPLQALVLMNDPTYVEAARKLAERVLREADSSEARVDLAYRLTLGRSPRDNERQVLLRILNEQRSVYRDNAEAADQLLKVGEAQRDAQLDPVEVASWTIVANVILNLDQTVTKG